MESEKLLTDVEMKALKERIPKQLRTVLKQSVKHYAAAAAQQVVDKESDELIKIALQNMVREKMAEMAGKPLPKPMAPRKNIF